MITQKPISLKIDRRLLEDLDEEASFGYHKRNWHINQAIALYLEVQNLKRLLSSDVEAGLKHDEVQSFLINRITYGDQW